MVYGWYIMRESKSKTAILLGWRLWTVLLQRWRSLLWVLQSSLHCCWPDHATSSLLKCMTPSFGLIGHAPDGAQSGWNHGHAVMVGKWLWTCNGQSQTLQQMIVYSTVDSRLVPRPFLPPVFDHLPYAKTEGEGLGERVTCVTSARCDGGGAQSL